MNKSFARRLKSAMEQAGMSQTALAEKTGAAKSSISQYLAGISTPGLARMVTLAQALGVSLDYLMGYKEEAAETGHSGKKITIRAAARCMGKSDQFIRIGLQRGLLPIGNAIPGTGSRWNYFINPAQFRAFIGAERFDEFFAE